MSEETMFQFNYNAILIAGNSNTNLVDMEKSLAPLKKKILSAHSVSDTISYFKADLPVIVVLFFEKRTDSNKIVKRIKENLDMTEEFKPAAIPQIFIIEPGMMIKKIRNINMTQQEKLTYNRPNLLKTVKNAFQRISAGL
ncbi:MAG: hypothetical protein JW860_09495 [Sedimentisphaerales bacterium]|nr:hypothetical protein [Sedimentisphaerales bacterium]